jgi:hypothetical protein
MMDSKEISEVFEESKHASKRSVCRTDMTRPAMHKARK